MEYQYQIGQKVMWSGGWGSLPPKVAVVVDYGEKNGKPVYDLHNGHWAYEEQLQILNEEV
jgi:hypothetical protein